MRKLLIALVAAAALAVPATALAWDGHHHHHHFGVLAAFFVKGDGDHGQFAVRAGGDNDENSQGEDNDNDENEAPAMVAQLSGTGTSFGANTATATGNIVGGNDHQNGHFSVSLNTDWAAAQSKTFTEEDGDTVTISCAPATASSTLTNGSTTNTDFTGKTCSKTDEGTTKYGFFGSSTTDVRLFLKEDGTTVMGAQFSGGEAEGWHH